MPEKLIRDIPSIQKNLQDYQTLQFIKKAIPILRPLLRLIGVDVKKIDDALSQTDKIEQLAKDIAIIPDRFNDLFAERGWIMYDLMSLEVAKVAIQIAEAGDFERAELELTKYYNPETVTWKLKTLSGLQSFRPRMRLAEKALIDYREERYHACIPVILALLDGLVNELHEQRRGFFAEDVNLEAWDSVAAHSKGLNVLTGLFQKGRRKTVTDSISIPYRNGIMHGMDLGYDNQVVAAKAWAALFATREWALKAERGLLTPPPEKPPKTFWQVIQQIRDNQEEIDRLKQWKPRGISIAVDAPSTGSAEAFTPDTPEQKLAEFLMYWKARNYGYMVRCLTTNINKYHAKPAAEIKSVYSARNLVEFEYIEITDLAPAVTEVQAKLTYREDDSIIEKSVCFRMLNEDDTGDFVSRGKPNSKWTILNWRL